MTRPDVGLVAAALLPTGVRAVWVLVMIALVVLFVRRALDSVEERRVWHAVYALLAACMGVMFAFNPMVAPSPAGYGVLAVAGVGAVGLATWMVARRDIGGLALPWGLALADLVVTAYMQVPSPSRPVIVCSAMAAYLAVQVIVRLIAAVRLRRGDVVVADRSRRFVGAAAGPDPEVASQRPAGRTARAARTTRPAAKTGSALTSVALSTLALGMLYMISI